MVLRFPRLIVNHPDNVGGNRPPWRCASMAPENKRNEQNKATNGSLIILLPGNVPFEMSLTGLASYNVQLQKTGASICDYQANLFDFSLVSFTKAIRI